MTLPRAACILLVFCLLFGACTSRDAPPMSTRPPASTRSLPFASAFALKDTVRLQQDGAPIVRISGLEIEPGTHRILLADASEGNVKLFDSTGRLIRILGSRGTGPGQFTEPRYPRFGPDGSIHVCEGAGRISVFTSSGDFARLIQTKVTFVTGFALRPNGTYILAGPAALGASLVEVTNDGTTLRVFPVLARIPVKDHPDDPRWRGLMSVYLSMRHDTAFVVTTLSDTLWAVSLSDSTAEAIGLPLPSYQPPKLPTRAAEAQGKPFAWANAFHRATTPIITATAVAIPLVQGILNYGDPSIIALYEHGQVIELTSGVPLLASDGNTIYALHTPNDTAVVLARYQALVPAN